MGSDSHEGLIKFLINDGTLTSEENGYFTKLRAGLDSIGSNGYSSSVNVLDALKNSDPKGYSKVCYEIGEACLFYYDIGVEKDKYATAALWFQYAKDDYPIAKVYCDISDCMQNISKYSKAGQLLKLNQEYTTLWNQIVTLNKDVVNNFSDDTEGLDLKFQVWNEIINMIRNNSSELCEVDSKENIIAFMNEINEKSSKIENAFLKDSIAKLQNNIK